MCVVSMVMDNYGERFPIPDGTAVPSLDWPTTPLTPTLWQPPLDLEELRKLIAEFKEAVAAARTVDRLTGQPDCEDPDKMKLEARVAELERRIEIYELRDALRRCVDAWDTDEGMTEACEAARKLLGGT